MAGLFPQIELFTAEPQVSVVSEVRVIRCCSSATEVRAVEPIRTNTELFASVATRVASAVSMLLVSCW